MFVQTACRISSVENLNEELLSWNGRNAGRRVSISGSKTADAPYKTEALLNTVLVIVI